MRASFFLFLVLFAGLGTGTNISLSATPNLTYPDAPINISLYATDLTRMINTLNLSVKTPNNTTYFINNYSSVKDSDYYSYQELANAVFSGFTSNPTYAYNDNWSDFATSTITIEQSLFVNYTKSTSFLTNMGTLWQMKFNNSTGTGINRGVFNITNVSIPYNCLNYSTTQINLRFTVFAQNEVFNTSCWNNSGWEKIISGETYGGDGLRFYEEGIFWNASNFTPINTTVLFNETTIPGTYTIMADYALSDGVTGSLNTTFTIVFNITNCTAGNTSTVLNFTTKNESSGSLISSNAWITFKLISGSNQINVTATSLNKQIHSFCISPAFANITLDADITYIDNATTAATTQRMYYLCNTTLSNTSPVSVTSYLLNLTKSELITMSAIEGVSGAEDVVIRALRWYPSTGIWTQVGMAKTGYDGIAVMDLEQNTVFYNFLLYRDCGYIQESGGTLILDAELSPFLIYEQEPLLAYSPFIEWDCENDSVTLSCFFSNSQGWDLTPCVYVYDLILNATNYSVLNCSNCGEPGASATVTCGFGNLTNRYITYKTTVDVEDNTITLGWGSLQGERTNPFGVEQSAFLEIFVTLAFAGMAISHPSFSIIAYLFAKTVMVILGISTIGLETLASLILLGIIALLEADR